jgi:hypothetical protein
VSQVETEKMSTHQNIVIRLIRKNAKKAKEDDVITVSRTYCNGTLKMVYKDAKNNDSTYLTTLSENGFIRYLENLFVMLENDRDPFENVQVSFPQYPCILFKVGDVGRYTIQDSVKEAVKDTFASWKMNTIHEMWNYEDA